MIVLRSVLAFLAFALAALPGGCAVNSEMSLVETFETGAAGSDFGPDPGLDPGLDSGPDSGPESGQGSRQELGPTSDQATRPDAPAGLTEGARVAENAPGGPTGLITRDDREATLLYLRSLSQSVRGSSTRQLSTSAAELKHLRATHAEKAISEIENGS